MNRHLTLLFQNENTLFSSQPCCYSYTIVTFLSQPRVCHNCCLPRKKVKQYFIVTRCFFFFFFLSITGRRVANIILEIQASTSTGLISGLCYDSLAQIKEIADSSWHFTHFPLVKGQQWAFCDKDCKVIMRWRRICLCLNWRQNRPPVMSEGQ